LYCKKTISKKLSNMKFLGITLSLLTASSCNAFAPTIIGVSRAQALNAETLEGWKIDGKIKPVNNFILIRKKENAVETDSGILISDKAQIVKTEGTVVDVGPGKQHPDSGIPFPMPVEAGDNVVYGQFDGTEVLIDGVTHSLIRDDDILVKFNGDTLSEENVVVVNDGLLVFVETKQTETSGGLVIGASSTSQKRPSTGVVTKVGPGRMVASGELSPMNAEVGDQVKFMDFAGNEIKIGDREFSVVKMGEVLAKF